MVFENIIKRVSNYSPAADLSLLRKAYDFAEKNHRGQVRNSGDPYIDHPVAVSYILAGLELDTETLEAGLLHDTVEDTGVTLEQIEEEFGNEVALLVDGVTKLSRLEYHTKEERQVENLRKMFLAMAKDIRVVLIKLADRLHNMRTLEHQSEEKQKEIAGETLDIYAPLAHRLGISHFKWELEDLAFRYSAPVKYYEMADKLKRSRRMREEYINDIITKLKYKLAKMKINAEINGRPKHLYSIYQKMSRQNINFNEVFDVMAVRIIVDTVRDCYASLGIVHTMWVPIPGRFKDYIAMPKSNMYQSLHTTVVGPHGEPFEIQIRTWEMHRTAEYGIAAHWMYKEGKLEGQETNEKLSWLRQILEWQHELRDTREFMENLKIDLFTDTVFVFTPQGDVIELPAGAVPIDFAYRIHTHVGHSCVGAKVNNRIVPLDYKLKNGDIVEITTSKQNNGPSRDWLNIVKTSQAKTRVRHWFKKEEREDDITKGKENLEKEAKKQGVDIDEIKNEKLLEYGKKISVNSAEDVLAAIGCGKVSAQGIINRFLEERTEPDKKGFLEEEKQALVTETKPSFPHQKPAEGIKVKGMDNLLVRLAHCCNPVPGDSIIGYITRGRGVSIHRADCRNLQSLIAEDESRIVEVEWEEGFDSPFQVRLEVVGTDRAGLLSDIMAILTDIKMSANWVNARGSKNHQAIIELILQAKSLEQLTYVMNRINKVQDVYRVYRRGHH
ncbi:MAG: bifunctional (p)ppGpp synthetase/guanosine-3',5'-bis(diphosphate) 3'-pyrophosphohydrolase [Clostridiales bacterium]|nr:bifunctional (p)ppGpp synthetase/guanosine-3',5'-bis(diphosphate) 3'-pyrophosphohydrolase [Clostridiales bacterium]MCF8021104.1 bifunctional (p)ppGpp synthetase/guanosine-3',5'-bis(diphosphate) 3'-pyrophosphohydrolase [Clostridiales bacterium]